MSKLPVGGDPGSVGDGGAQLSKTARQVTTRSTGLTSAGAKGASGSGGSAVEASLARFVAAYGRFTDDVAVELDALGNLASHTAADLNVAGGNGNGGGRYAPQAR